MKKILPILIFIMMLMPGLIWAQVDYYATSGTTKVAWNAVSYAIDHYEVVLTRDTGEAYSYGTSSTQMIIPRPRSGKFTVKVRAVQAGGAASGYCVSTDSSCSLLVDGVTPGGWKVLFRPTAPIGPIHKSP